MLIKRTTLSHAIKLACTGMVAGSFAFGGVVMAADEEPVALEKEAVTGSHIKQIDIQGASPIAVISREDIEMSGLQSVAEVLRRTPYNTAGSYTSTSGNSFQSQATVDLRGLGAERTLVLFNGHRMPNSPVMGNAGVDLNILPLAAVERIEILKDSASAIYGSEAIGGVINIILRKDYEGFEITAGVERPSEKGGDAEHASLVTGGTHSKGNFVASLEWRKKDIIWSRDRPWSDTELGDGSDWFTTENMSINGNTWEDPATGIWTAATPCDSPFSGTYNFAALGWDDTVCMYPYADISGETASVENANAFLYLDYEINNEHSLYLQNVISRVEGFGRYAPALDGGLAVGEDNPFNPFGKDMNLRHRFAAVGPRDTTMTNWQWDAMIGAKGTILSSIDYDAYVRYNLYDGDQDGRNYVLISAAEEQMALGNYNFLDPLSQDPAHLEAVNAMRYSISRDIQNDYFNAGFNLTGDTPWEIGGGNIAWAAGYEYRDEQYRDIYDPQSEAENVAGSAGNSSEGERDQYAVYGEAMFPVLDNLELSAALRFDSYSDFGSEVSPQLKARWQPIDSLMLRASWGEGFRAPSLDDLYGARSFSAETVTDWVFCRDNGISDADCPSGQQDTYRGGNPELDAESSESWNLGAVFEPLDDLVFELDYYNISMDDVVGLIGAQNLLNMELDGEAFPSGIGVFRKANGRIDYIEDSKTNVATREVEGFDFSVGYLWDGGEWGSLQPKLVWAHTLKYNFQASDFTTLEDVAGQYNFGPEDRAQFSLRWNINDFTVGWITDYIGKMEAVYNLPSYTEHTLSLAWEAPWDATITGGARNLFDEEPPIDVRVDSASNLYYFYPIDGRVLTLSYTQRF